MVAKLLLVELFVDTQNTANQCKRIRFASFFVIYHPFPENSVTFANETAIESV